jgi:hypothetical protein
MPKNASAASTAALTVFRLAALFTFLAVAMGRWCVPPGQGLPALPGRVAVQTRLARSGS